MGQKHNRRRTRPRSRHQNSISIDPPLLPVTISNATIPFASDNQHLSTYSSPSLSSAFSSCDCSPIPPAQLWHNRYMVWQNHERKQRLEASKLEAEQCRLFGGEPGDDVSLCYRMLEYFGRLDYIDSLPHD
ncbi:hypothetical protein VTN00DRAFT_9185 [Thermoascus crustaceus]|uniref:uncharacterized protein n=1 Tax=Thermoascus crustaceus TaxID=5088 RepID=UPI0037426F4E